MSKCSFFACDSPSSCVVCRLFCHAQNNNQIDIETIFKIVESCTVNKLCDRFLHSAHTNSNMYKLVPSSIKDGACMIKVG